MKKLKCLLLYLILSFSIGTEVYAQVSKQDAIDLVFDSIIMNRVDSVNVYMEPAVLTDAYYVISPYDSIEAPYSNYWLAFIDDFPMLYWEHSCTYVFINQINDNFTKVNYFLPPINYQVEMDSLSVPFFIEKPILNYSVHYNALRAEENSHYYAVIFSGFGQNTEFAYWNHLSHMYCALREKGFPAENIYALCGDGTVGDGPWSNESLNLDNDENENDILNVPCSVDNLENIFQQLEESELDEDDLLFIFVSTHGGIQDAGEDESYLRLYNEEQLWDYELETMLEGIICSQMIIPIFSCHSGGFVDNLMVSKHNEKRTVFTPVGRDLAYWKADEFIEDYGLGKYPFFLITALRGYFPDTKETPWVQGFIIGTHPDDPKYDFFHDDFNPDEENGGNEDGTIQFEEVFNYTKHFDKAFNDYGVIEYDCGFQEDLLSLTGLSGRVENTQNVDGYFMFGGDITLTDNATLSIADESKLFLINGDFTTELGTELELGDDMEIQNFQETASINVNGDFSAGTNISFSSQSGTSLNMVFNNANLDVEFTDCDFENVGLSSYTNSLDINQYSTFTNSTIGGVRHLYVDQSTFNSSSINIMAPGLSNFSATITDSDFTLPFPESNNIISLYRFANYYISGNTFSNYYRDNTHEKNSIIIEYSGTTGPTVANNISNNTFVSNEPGYSKTEGITIYGSIANIFNNNIQNQHVGILLYDKSQSNLAGTTNFCNEETQVIKNNDVYQVYCSEKSFPVEFIWNAVYENTLNDVFVFHDVDMNQNPPNVVVRNNYWSDNYNPYNNLLPIGHYNITPIYDPCSKSATILTDEEVLYQTGIDYIADSNFSEAKNIFQLVVTEYPESEFAVHALKELFYLEPLVNNDFSGLRNWYLTEQEILNNYHLLKLGQGLANKCNEMLGNYQEAIDWYEDMIDNPPSLQDSIFAVIDLQNVYILMGADTSSRGNSVVGRMPKYKPESIKAHQDYRDKLLALLLNRSNININNESANDSTSFLLYKQGELLQNVPNPFSNTTSIQFNLNSGDFSSVEIRIHDQVGKEVQRIPVKSAKEGSNTVELNMQGLPSGIYYYSLIVNGTQADTKKMVVVR